MASAVKMSTASFYKGQTAIFGQALRSAQANGVLEVVLDDFRRHYPELVADASLLVQRMAAKSGRYVAEMEEIAGTQDRAGLTPELFQAFADVYRRMSEGDLAESAPEEADPGLALGPLLDRLGRPLD